MPRLLRATIVSLYCALLAPWEPKATRRVLNACRYMLVAFLGSMSLSIPGIAQERLTILPLNEFINSVSASEAARIAAQREWALANCPKHLTASMWLSPLGLTYVDTLRALDPGDFKKSIAANTADLNAVLKDWETDDPKEVSAKRYGFCQEIWRTHLVVEDNASKAYWAAGWQPKKHEK